jgi:hypothetical protein
VLGGSEYVSMHAANILSCRLALMFQSTLILHTAG